MANEGLLTYLPDISIATVYVMDWLCHVALGLDLYSRHRGKVGKVSVERIIRFRTDAESNLSWIAAPGRMSAGLS